MGGLLDRTKLGKRRNVRLKKGASIDSSGLQSVVALV